MVTEISAERINNMNSPGLRPFEARVVARLGWIGTQDREGIVIVTSESAKSQRAFDGVYITNGAGKGKGKDESRPAGRPDEKKRPGSGTGTGDKDISKNPREGGGDDSDQGSKK